MRCCSAAYAATNDANPRCPGESRDASAGERQQDGASPHHRARSLFHTFFASTKMNSLIRMDGGSTQHVATETHAIGAGVVLPAPPYPPGAAQFHQQLAAGKGLLHPTASAPVADSCGAEEGAVAALSDAESQLVSSTADRVWPCSKVLAQALSRSDDSLPSVVDCRGCRVLELGSGLGLAGLCAWRAGAASVVLTELGENLPRLKSGVYFSASFLTRSLNQPPGTCTTYRLPDLPCARTFKPKHAQMRCHTHLHHPSRSHSIKGATPPTMGTVPILSVYALSSLPQMPPWHDVILAALASACCERSPSPA
jgi:hypothetical protein